MRVKARPDVHYAPLTDGVFVSAGSHELALRGWSGFTTLLDTSISLLRAGTDEDSIVRGLGGEAARPAVRSLLERLVEHDMVFRLDDAGPAPSASEREQYADLLAFTETHASAPYVAFRRVLDTPVVLHGSPVTLAAGARVLTGLGLRPSPVTRLESHHTGILLAEVGAGQSLPDGVVIPVVDAGDRFIVGPVLHDERTRTTWRTLVERVATRPGSGRPSAAVASSLAAHLLIRHLTEVAGEDAYVVSGERSDTRGLQLPVPVPNAGIDRLPAADETPTDFSHLLPQLSDPWIGSAQAVDDSRIPQLPVAVRRVRTELGVEVIGAGATQRCSTERAVLAAIRGHAREVEPSRVTHAAGTSARRWLLDGALRLLSEQAIDIEAPGTTGTNAESVRLRRAAQRRIGGDLRTRVLGVDGLLWKLVHLESQLGVVRAWGRTSIEAEIEALNRLIAAVDAGADADLSPSTWIGPNCGTDVLLEATVDETDELQQQVVAWAREHRLRLVGHRRPGDPLIDDAAIWHGPVRWQTETDDVVDGDADRPDDEVAVWGQDADVLTMHGWAPDALTDAIGAARAHDRPVVTVRFDAGSITVGPRWSPGSSTGCAGCAHMRRRAVQDHVLTDPGVRLDARQQHTPTALLRAAQSALAQAPLRDGELLTASDSGIERHHIARLAQCPWCGVPDGLPDEAAVIELRDDPIGADPTRVADGTPLLDEKTLLGAGIDAAYGPVRGILREANVPMAMSMATLTGAPVLGHGRGLTFAGTRSVAVLEAYERLAGFPYEAPLVRDTAHCDLGDEALDPLSLGRYTETQLAHPTSKVLRYTPHQPIDWAVGTDLASGLRRLVPAEVGFYQYDYVFKRNRAAAIAADPAERVRCFLESSSGCAVGSTAAEAAIHALLEVAERDAFQIAWHAGRSLPQIAPASFRDRVIDELIELVESRGYEVHFLRATHDIDVPIIWVLAVARDGRFPATFSSAGSGAEPAAAARGGLREVAQLITAPLDWSEQDADARARDPWQVTELEHHVHASSSALMLDRVTRVLGGPVLQVDAAFPGWPVKLRPADGAIVGTLNELRARFAAAGLDEIVLVDQSNREHRDQRISVVKAVVPGSVPMCFGQAHQRLAAIPRLDAVLDRPAAELQLDPHPFP